MSDRINEYMEWIEHRGIRLMHIDYRGLVGDAVVRQVRENGEAIIEIGMRGEKDQLRLVDVRDGFATQEILAAFKEVGVAITPYSRATAVVGLTGRQKRLLWIYNRLTGRGARPFDDHDKAKDWLVKQAKR